MSVPPDRILLVEDNPDDVALTLRAFSRNKLTNPVEVVGDGIDAIDFLLAGGRFADRAGLPIPKLVLLDLKLPRLDGLGVLKAMRSDPRTRLIPVLILTSSSLHQDLESCYALGANSYLLKPIDFAEFAELVRVTVLYWLTLNQTPALRGAA